MQSILLCAIAVGGATLLGALFGFIIKNPTPALSGAILSLAAGIMLAAAIIGLILPAVEGGSLVSVAISTLGIFAGALTLELTDRLSARIFSAKRSDIADEEVRRVLLFVFAIALHNLPEGIAAGVGFGSKSASLGFMIAGSIALHNLPEGMVVIAPLLAVGIKRKSALGIAASTALVEILGTVLGYFAVSVCRAVLPFLLSFAGGTMLFVICDEMIPETHTTKTKGSIYALLLGFSLMLAANALLPR